MIISVIFYHTSTVADAVLRRPWDTFPLWQIKEKVKKLTHSKKAPEPQCCLNLHVVEHQQGFLQLLPT